MRDAYQAERSRLIKGEGNGLGGAGIRVRVEIKLVYSKGVLLGLGDESKGHRISHREAELRGDKFAPHCRQGPPG